MIKLPTRPPKQPVYISSSAFRLNTPEPLTHVVEILDQLGNTQPDRIYAASILGHMKQRQALFAQNASLSELMDDDMGNLLSKRFPDTPLINVNSACTSGATALKLAVNQIQTRQIEQILIIAYEEQTAFNRAGFESLKTLTSTPP